MFLLLQILRSVSVKQAEWLFLRCVPCYRGHAGHLAFSYLYHIGKINISRGIVPAAFIDKDIP